MPILSHLERIKPPHLLHQRKRIASLIPALRDLSSGRFAADYSGNTLGKIPPLAVRISVQRIAALRFILGSMLDHLADVHSLRNAEL